MIRYFKNIALLLLIVIIGCERNFNLFEDQSSLKIEFIVTGGFAGIHHETSIYDNGDIEFIHNFWPKQYIIQTLLSKSQLDSLNTFLDEKEIFDLNDRYKRDQPVVDNIYYEISYHSTSGEIKNIFIEGLTELPEILYNIINYILNINNFVQSNSDYGTLVSKWSIDAVIKEWIFNDINLEKKTYYYNEISNSDSILAYFEGIKRDIGYNILYLSQDSLYDIYDGGTDYGYFKVLKIYKAKLWGDYFQDDISIVKENGICRLMSEWDKMNISLNDTYVYVIDKIEDNGRAIELKLIPGKPYNN